MYILVTLVSLWTPFVWSSKVSSRNIDNQVYNRYLRQIRVDILINHFPNTSPTIDEYYNGLLNSSIKSPILGLLRTLSSKTLQSCFIHKVPDELIPKKYTKVQVYQNNVNQFLKNHPNSMVFHTCFEVLTQVFDYILGNPLYKDTMLKLTGTFIIDVFRVLRLGQYGDIFGEGIVDENRSKIINLLHKLKTRNVFKTNMTNFINKMPHIKYTDQFNDVKNDPELLKEFFKSQHPPEWTYFLSLYKIGANGQIGHVNYIEIFRNVLKSIDFPLINTNPILLPDIDERMLEMTDERFNEVFSKSNPPRLISVEEEINFFLLSYELSSVAIRDIFALETIGLSFNKTNNIGYTNTSRFNYSKKAFSAVYSNYSSIPDFQITLPEGAWNDTRSINIDVLSKIQEFMRDSKIGHNSDDIGVAVAHMLGEVTTNILMGETDQYTGDTIFLFLLNRLRYLLNILRTGNLDIFEKFNDFSKAVLSTSDNLMPQLKLPNSLEENIYIISYMITFNITFSLLSGFLNKHTTNIRSKLYSTLGEKFKQKQRKSNINLTTLLWREETHFDYYQSHVEFVEEYALKYRNLKGHVYIISHEDIKYEGYNEDIEIKYNHCNSCQLLNELFMNLIEELNSLMVIVKKDYMVEHTDFINKNFTHYKLWINAFSLYSKNTRPNKFLMNENMKELALFRDYKLLPILSIHNRDGLDFFMKRIYEQCLSSSFLRFNVIAVLYSHLANRLHDSFNQSVFHGAGIEYIQNILNETISTPTETRLTYLLKPFVLGTMMDTSLKVNEYPNTIFKLLNNVMNDVLNTPSSRSLLLPNKTEVVKEFVGTRILRYFSLRTLIKLLENESGTNYSSAFNLLPWLYQNIHILNHNTEYNSDIFHHLDITQFNQLPKAFEQHETYGDKYIQIGAFRGILHTVLKNQLSMLNVSTSHTLFMPNVFFRKVISADKDTITSYVKNHFGILKIFHDYLNPLPEDILEGVKIVHNIYDRFAYVRRNGQGLITEPKETKLDFGFTAQEPSSDIMDNPKQFVYEECLNTHKLLSNIYNKLKTKTYTKESLVRALLNTPDKHGYYTISEEAIVDANEIWNEIDNNPLTLNTFLSPLRDDSISGEERLSNLLKYILLYLTTCRQFRHEFTIAYSGITVSIFEILSIAVSVCRSYPSRMNDKPISPEGQRLLTVRRSQEEGDVEKWTTHTSRPRANAKNLTIKSFYPKKTSDFVLSEDSLVGQHRNRIIEGAADEEAKSLPKRRYMIHLLGMDQRKPILDYASLSAELEVLINTIYYIIYPREYKESILNYFTKIIKPIE